VDPVLTPVFYATVMGVSGNGSLLLGRIFDRAGIVVLIPPAVVAALSALIVLSAFPR
jgi:hypothetical protein